MTIDGDDVGNRASARAARTLLLGEEEPSARGSVRDALTEACELRRSRAAVEEWLSAAGLSDLGQRAPQRLSPHERRAAALAFALGADDAARCTYEPLLLVPRVSERFVLERCRSRASARSWSLTTSLEHALRFGGSPFWLERGRLQGPSRGHSARRPLVHATGAERVRAAARG